MDFDNLDSLISYIESDYGTEEIATIMLEELKRLKTIVLANIQGWYTTYKPKKYNRTDLWYETLQVGGVKATKDGIIQGNLFFDDMASLHPSLWHQKDGYVPLLMDTGWHINWSRPYRIKMLSDFKGTHYLERSIKEYNESNPYGFVATMSIEGSLMMTF